MPSAARVLPVRSVVRLLRALGDETRLRIVALLTHGELCVCHVEKALGLTQPTASRHLAVLRTAEVVEARRDAGWVYYRIAPQVDQDCKSVLAALSRSFGKQATLRSDVEELRRGKKGEMCGKSSARAAKPTRPAVKGAVPRRGAKRESSGISTARAAAAGGRSPEAARAKPAARKAPSKSKSKDCSDCG